MKEWPVLKEFRLEEGTKGIVHLIFDMPGRSMNVFSNSAIEDINRFAAWLSVSDARGCVVRSGKPSGFCAGADLPEIEAAYDKLAAVPPEQRVKAAFDHFFRLSRGFRSLETSGKPVAAAIRGLALGGGCELALACHYRVMTSGSETALGLPESLVGLLPGAGGTQRLPRLVGVEASLPVLLDGARLGGDKALETGAAHEVSRLGDEISAAERWILTGPAPRQPWDRSDRLQAPGIASSPIAPERAKRLAQTLGHYPAITAILDCVERGLPLQMDAALEVEMDIFSHLIQRPEPRAMIRTLFMGRLDYERSKKRGALPAMLSTVLNGVRTALAAQLERYRTEGVRQDKIDAAMRLAGFAAEGADKSPATVAEGPGYWFELPLKTPEERLAAELLAVTANAVEPYLGQISESDERAINYAACTQIDYPSYTGGPLALARYFTSQAPKER